MSLVIQYKKVLSILGIGMLLGACHIIPEQKNKENQNTEQDAPIVDGKLIVNRPYNDYYRPLINEDGSYPASENRGVTLTLNSGINLDLFEDDLLRLSTDHFSTDQHFIQEGQLLLKDTVNNWLKRQSNDNPTGLNPSEDQTDSPLYLSSILEHDFYKQEDNKFELSGMTIGLAMNSTYETSSGSTQIIEHQDIVNQAREMASTIITRIRESDTIGNIPIVIGIYEQTASSDISGGVYVLEGYNKADSKEIEWTDLNEQRLIFPLEGEETEEGNMFRNFKEDIEQAFPSLNGVYARAHYVDDNLMSLDINITTKFYGRSEIVALTQYLRTAAGKHLPEHSRIQIEVESLNRVESFLSRSLGENEFYSHIFY